MPVSADVLVSINNSTLENYLDKGKVWKQNIANKPMLAAFNRYAGSFGGGKEYVSLAVKAGQGGGSLQGYSYDDQVTYYNPATIKRARYPWKEHHIGVTLTHTELKIDGIDVTDTNGEGTRRMEGREQFALANTLDEKNDELGEDYAFSLDRLLHADGSVDVKAIAGIGAFLLPVPNTGVTGGINRATTPYWRNRAATAAYGSAGGQGAISSASTGGGVLISFLEKEELQRAKYARGSTNTQIFAGSDWIDAYSKEMRANGYYSQTGWKGTQDGGMGKLEWKGKPIVYDPTMDDLGLSKRAYFIDMGKTGLRLLYMDGQRMKKHHPARPYDRYTMYNGITMTGVLVARSLNTSGVYDIA